MVFVNNLLMVEERFGSLKMTNDHNRLFDTPLRGEEGLPLSGIGHGARPLFSPAMLKPELAQARIVVADDHCLTAELLQYYLLGAAETPSLGSEPPLLFNTAREALQECRERGADLLIMDVCLPDMAPLELLSAILSQLPGTRVLIFSRWVHPSLCSGFIKAGVHGIIFKTDSLAHLGRAIATILSGGRYFSPAIEKMTFEKLLCGLECLTEREQSALSYIAQGQSTKEMAHSMAITPKTAEKYRERLMNKLNLHDAIQLTHFAIRTGLVAV